MKLDIRRGTTSEGKAIAETLASILKTSGLLRV